MSVYVPDDRSSISCLFPKSVVSLPVCALQLRKEIKTVKTAAVAASSKDGEDGGDKEDGSGRDGRDDAEPISSSGAVDKRPQPQPLSDTDGRLVGELHIPLCSVLVLSRHPLPVFQNSFIVATGFVCGAVRVLCRHLVNVPVGASVWCQSGLHLVLPAEARNSGTDKNGFLNAFFFCRNSPSFRPSTVTCSFLKCYV